MSDEQKTEVLGVEGELCESCHAPLAPDQRYFPNCGARRAGPRVDYANYMAPAAHRAAAPPVNGNGAPQASWDPAPPSGDPKNKPRVYTPASVGGGTGP